MSETTEEKKPDAKDLEDSVLKGETKSEAPAQEPVEVDAAKTTVEFEESVVADKAVVAEETVVEDEKTETEQVSAPFTPDLDAPSFKEESYKVGELKEAERKALEAFRVKVEEAIKKKTIFRKEKKKVIETAVVSIEKESEVQDKESEATELVTLEKEISETVIVEVEEHDNGKNESTASEVEAVVLKEEVIVTKEIKADEGEAAKEDAVTNEGEEVVAEPPVHPTNFYLWGGISVHAEDDEKTDVVLLKFLRARNFKVEESLSMLKNTVRWRLDFNADSILDEELGEEGFDELTYEKGVDREGHPVCYNLNPFQNKDLCEDKEKLAKFLRWRVQVMEKSVRSLDFSAGGINSIVQVIDFQNAPGFRKRSVQAIKKFLTLLQDNYPELAAKQIFLNVPWWYVPTVYRPSNHSKVIWAVPGKATETLFKYISPEHVPVRYGGFSRPNDPEFDGVEATVTEIVVKAGEKREIEFPVEEGGSRVVWDVSVVGWDVVYGEEFVPETYTVVVRKPSKVGPVAEPIRNSYKASEPGNILLTIDNSLAKKKKTVAYRFKCTKQQQQQQQLT